MGRLRFVGVVPYGLLYAGCYWLSDRFGLVPPHNGVSVLWLPSGLQVSALLLTRDRRVWPLILASGFTAELLSDWWLFGPPTHVSVYAAVGNALEATLAATLVRLIGGQAVPSLHRSREVLGVGVGAVVAPAINASLMSHWVAFRAYWIGDLTGIVALVPLVLTARFTLLEVRRGAPLFRRSPLELGSFVVALIGAIYFVFGRSGLSVADASAVVAMWPILAWAAFRIGPMSTAATNLLAVVAADLFTREGYGPFGSVSQSAASRVGALQGFLSVLSLSSMALASGLFEREQAETALATAGESDPVTGLPNLDGARAMVERSRMNGSVTAVLVVDLDDFTDVNDRFGRSVGDEVLRQVAERLKVPLRTEDVVARMSGDAFVVVVSRLTGVRSAEVTAERVLATLTPPFVVENHVIPVSACSGLALMESRESADRVLSRAVAAVVHAKSGGPGRSASLDAEAYGRLDEARRVQSQLHRAIAAEQLEVYYQPIIDVRSSRLVAMEALLRWHHPQRGLLNAGSFVPGAESSGLVVALDDWVFSHSLDDLRMLRERPGLDELTLFVNVSARTLAEPDSSDRIRSALRAHGVSPTSVVIEVTETALVDDTETGRRAAAELASAGVSLALDDFGQGHASLARLRALPISVVKIDHSFVSGMGSHEIDDAVVRWVTVLARQLRMSTVAEGVESADQLSKLASIGVDFAQGYGIARPMPLSELMRIVDGEGALVPVSDVTGPRG